MLDFEQATEGSPVKSEAFEDSQHVERLAQRIEFRALDAVYAGVWLLMLAFPLVSTLTSDVSLTAKVIFVVINIVFATVYIVGFGYHASLSQAGRKDVVAWWMVACIVLIVSTSILIGPFTVSYSPWLVALFVFPLPLRWGIALAAATTIIAIVLTLALFDDQMLRFIFSSVSGGSAILITSIAVASQIAENRENLTKKLLVSKERENIARDVHDLLGHSLTVINLKAELAHKVVERDPSTAKRELQEISGLSRTALAEVRSTVTRLNRPNFAGEVLAAGRALDTAGILADLPDADAAQMTAGNNAHLYSWVLREAITNIVRHSNAKHCSVHMTPEKLHIVDDGSGWDGEYGGGLIGLQNRVEESGGTLIIHSRENHGTSVFLSMSGDIEPMEHTRVEHNTIKHDYNPAQGSQS
ncbi:MAG: sensor histidine kinase [Canibacter sp.]